MRFLIVEDENVTRNLMKAIMDLYGICDDVGDGVSAVEAFEKAWKHGMPYDVIMLDITLPEMNGMDVLIQIRNIEEKMKLTEAKRARIVMVTGHDDVDHMNTCLTAGCDSYLVKPATREDVARCLKNVYTKYIQQAIF